MKKTFVLFLIIMISAGMNISTAQLKIDVINAVKSSVVRIHSFNMPFTLDNEASYSTGTGYVADKEGLIITNNHVVKNSIGLLVYSPGIEKPYYASIVWKDSILDLAVIKAQDCDLQPLPLADPSLVKQGEEILIFGYPPGYKDENLKVSWGIISSDTRDSTLQTTAPVNPGNSGGPAVSLEGKVIGTVFAKWVELSVEGTGFIRNIKYSFDALKYAKKELTKPIQFYGTSSLEVYKLICDAAILGWNAYEAENFYEKDRLNESSKNLILAALNKDPNYADAYYFLAGYYFNKYLVLCLQNKDAEAVTAKDRFIKAFEDAEKRKPSLGYEDNSLSTLKSRIKNNQLSCNTLRDFINESQKTEESQQKRYEDFMNYIVTGQPPSLLRKSLEIKEGTKPPPPPPSIKSTFLKIGRFDIDNPIRLCVTFPSELENVYTKNIGCSFGNVGYTNSIRHIFFKHQLSFDLFQYHFNQTGGDDYMRYMIFSYNLGIQVKPFIKSRFNPKPFATVGINPVNYKVSSGTQGISSHWNLTNGAFNYGFDFDIWLTGYFGLSLSYERVLFFAKVIDTLYSEENGLPFEYSKFKLGIIF
jgi:hypothetical protein